MPSIVQPFFGPQLPPIHNASIDNMPDIFNGLLPTSILNTRSPVALKPRQPQNLNSFDVRTLKRRV